MSGVTRPGRKYECGLGEIELTRDLLHLLLRKSICLRNYGQLVSTETHLGKYITNVIAVFHAL
jgi:hypothetical protein